MLKPINKLIRQFGFELRKVKKKEDWPSPISPDESNWLDDQLTHFAKHISTDPSTSDPGSLRQYLSNRRLTFYQEVIRVMEKENVGLASKSIADVGSGMGFLLKLVHDNAPGSTVSGFDTFNEMNRLAELICPAGSFSDVNLFEINTQYDVILCTEVLEHLVHPEKALEKMRSLLKPGGQLVLTVPNGRIDQHEAMGKREDGNGYWGHIHFWSPESWLLFLNSNLNGVKTIKTGLLSTGENFAIITT